MEQIGQGDTEGRGDLYQVFKGDVCLSALQFAAIRPMDANAIRERFLRKAGGLPECSDSLSQRNANFLLH